MKPLSDQCKELLGALASQPVIIPRGGTGITEQVALLRQVAERHEAAAVLPLTDFLFHPSVPVAAAAADAISDILTAAAPQDLVSLDERVRGLAFFGPGPSAGSNSGRMKLPGCLAGPGRASRCWGWRVSIGAGMSGRRPYAY